jgi:hypothetical protein
LMIRRPQWYLIRRASPIRSDGVSRSTDDPMAAASRADISALHVSFWSKSNTWDRFARDRGREFSLGWCCSSGLLLGPAAMITGFIALSQSKKEPEHYGGRGSRSRGSLPAQYIWPSTWLLCLSILYP